MKRRTRGGAGWLAALLGMALLVVGLAPARAWAAEPGSLGEVYVSADGDDEAAGKKDAPVATLAKAVELAAAGTAEDPTEIYVMSDLTMTEPARFWNKHISVTSAGKTATVTRGEFDGEAGDPARQGYNSAMIEVNGQPDRGIVSTLRLSNIVFDDNGVHAGKYFVQAASRGDGTTDFGDLTTENENAIDNSDIVQDAMVAVYNGVGRVTLGDDAVLKNFGGMSAVRLSGGELVMESGSKITDDKLVESAEPSDALRYKGEIIPGASAGLYGPAGAIWMQGGTLLMEAGSQISDIDGRAIYNEAGAATVNGTISGAKANQAMWQGTSGSVMHLRVEAKATFGPTAIVDGDGVKLNGSGIDVLGGCSLTLANGSLVTGYDGGNVLNIGGKAYLNGEIAGLFGRGHAICAQGSSNHYIRIGETATIHDNICHYGVIYTQGDNGVIDIYGKMNDNVSTDRGGAVVLANNGTHVDVNMYDGAEMCRNVSYQTGGAIMVSCGTFTMYGGTISENISGADNVGEEDQAGGGVYVRRGGQFVMNGGTISKNSSGGIGGNIAVVTEDYNNSVAYVELNGGTVSTGIMGATISSSDDAYSVEGGVSNDIAVAGGSSFSHVRRYLSISDSLTLGNEDVFLDDYDIQMSNPGSRVKFGNAANECENAVTEAFKDQYLNVVVGSFWYHSASAAQKFSLSIENVANYDASKPLVAAYVATDENGQPVDGATPQLVPADVEGGQVSLTVPGGGNGYAVVLLQENDESRGIISIVPADLTAYVGGEDGYETVVGPEGETSESTLPRPVFRVVSSPKGVNVGDFVFTNTIVGSAGETISVHSWKLVPVEVTEGGEQYYRFEGTDAETPDVRFQFTDVDGKATTDGNFDLTDEQELYKQYRISIYSGAKEGQTSAVSVAIGDDPYTAVIGFGELTVRATADEKPITGVLESRPESLAPGTAAAVVSGETVYTLGGTDVVLSEDNEGFSPSLLFDGIIDDDADRTGALLARIEGATKENSQAKYLDLVDPNNGNAWIASSERVTVYWALPEGVPANAKVSLWHFEGLHRDVDGSGFDVSQVEGVTPKQIYITRDGSYVVFHIDEGGFSPFVLTWDEPDTPVTPTPDPDPDPGDDDEPGRPGPDDTGVSDWLDTVNHRAYLSGYGDGSGLFGVDEPMTRAEAATMLYNLLLDKSVGELDCDFPDLDEGAFYYEAVRVLASRGIVMGNGDGTFAPDRAITRAELVAIAMRFTDGEYDTSGGSPFPDVSEDDWFYGPVVGSQAYGWVSGYADGTFGPGDTLTRGQATAIVNHMLGRAADEEWAEANPEGVRTFPDVYEGHFAYGEVLEATNSHEYEREGDGTESWTGLSE